MDTMSAPDACCMSATTPRSTAARPDAVSSGGRICPHHRTGSPSPRRRQGETAPPAARALSMRRSGTIGVLIPRRLSTVFANQFLGELMQGLGELVEEHDFTLLLVPPLDGSLEGAIRRASVDGFISLGLSPDDEALATLDRIGIPTVLIDSEGSDLHPAVNVDDAGGAKAAAPHLLVLGHPPVGIVLLPPV